MSAFFDCRLRKQPRSLPVLRAITRTPGNGLAQLRYEVAGRANNRNFHHNGRGSIGRECLAVRPVTSTAGDAACSVIALRGLTANAGRQLRKAAGRQSFNLTAPDLFNHVVWDRFLDWILGTGVLSATSPRSDRRWSA